MTRTKTEAKPTGLHSWNKRLFEYLGKKYLVEDTHRSNEKNRVQALLLVVPASEVLMLADIGCGPGKIIETALPGIRARFSRYRVVGVDYSYEMIQAARLALEPYSDSAVMFTRADARQLPIGNSEAHLALLMNNTLGNVSVDAPSYDESFARGEGERLKVLAEISRMLQPLGKFLLSVYHNGKQHYDGSQVVHSNPQNGDFVFGWEGITYYTHWFGVDEIGGLLERAGFRLDTLDGVDARLIITATKKP